MEEVCHNLRVWDFSMSSFLNIYAPWSFYLPSSCLEFSPGNLATSVFISNKPVSPTWSSHIQIPSSMQTNWCVHCTCELHITIFDKPFSPSRWSSLCLNRSERLKLLCWVCGMRPCTQNWIGLVGKADKEVCWVTLLVAYWLLQRLSLPTCLSQTQ